MRRQLTTTFVAAAIASATATAASAGPLGALLGSLFGQRPAHQVTSATQPAATSAYAYAAEAVSPKARASRARHRL